MTESEEKHEELMTTLTGRESSPKKYGRKFRLLEASEIDCRVSTVKESGFSILLYKDARCDMNILDETIGAMNWKREHTRENANCIVSIFNPKSNDWVSKEDTGSESYAEKEKGLASDSFKRACFNWGIGRELYTAPFIWIKANENEVFKKGNKHSTYAKFSVSSISYDSNHSISSLVLVDSKGNQRFAFNNNPDQSNRGFKKMFDNALSLKELKLLWTSLDSKEQKAAFDIKEKRKLEILNIG